jgi:hypothetical protein
MKRWGWIIFVVVFAFLLWKANSHDTHQNNQTVSPQTGTSSAQDRIKQTWSLQITPEYIIKTYGRPNVIDSTDYDRPRPPIPTKVLTYKKERVRFIFLPDGVFGAPPPYKWKCIGATDPDMQVSLDLEEAFNRLSSRKKK